MFENWQAHLQAPTRRQADQVGPAGCQRKGDAVQRNLRLREPGIETDGFGEGLRVLRIERLAQIHRGETIGGLERDRE